MAFRSRITAALALLAIGLATQTAQAQKSGGTLRLHHREDPPTASIHEEVTISTVFPFMSVFNNLVIFDPASKQNRLDAIVPELATSWTWSEDGKRLTFKLRSGVKWHDGKPFTAKDVKCTWDWLSGKTESGWRKNPHKPWYFNLQSVEAEGDDQVAFVLERPQPSFLAMLAGGFSPVYPCHVPAAQMRSKPIGTGPFKLVDFQRGQSIKLARNPDYWRPSRPYLDALEFQIIPNRGTMMLAFFSGQFDMTFTGDVTPPLLKDVKAQKPDAICEEQPTGTQINLLVNRERPPFDSDKIRRAMSLALDRKAFIDIISLGHDIVGGALLPPPAGFWGEPPEVIATFLGYGADIGKSRDEARSIMGALGHSADKPLKIKLTTRNLAQYRDAAVILSDQFKQVFIDAELDVLDSSVWYTRLARRDFSVGLNVQGVPTDDPDIVFFETYGCKSDRNYTAYCNPALEEQFHRQSAMRDIEARRKLVWEIDRKLQEDGARPVIAHNRAATCWDPHVKGLSIAHNTIYNHWRFDDVWLDR